MTRRAVPAVAAALVVLLAAGCGSTDRRGGTAGGRLTVFAAASLTDAFEQLADAFESEHAGVRVELNLASSSTLAAQMIDGAPVDVFASADTRHMDAVANAGLVEPPVIVARNVLEIAVEAGNPLGIDSLEDLARDDVVLVLAAPQVPAGDLASQVLARAGVEVAPASLEVDVRATLARVELGEADAAIVYRSDVTSAADRVDGVAIPADRNLVVDHPMAVAVDAPNRDVAAAWVTFVTGAEGRAVLASAGLTTP